jgi:hypothetical protein
MKNRIIHFDEKLYFLLYSLTAKKKKKKKKN